MVYLKKIVVATDLSDYSLAAIEYAASFRLLYTSELFLVHILDIIPPTLSPYKTALAKSPDYSSQLADGRRQLQEFIATKINPDIAITPVVRSGSPAEEIKRFAEEEGADLIVMATHGRTGLKHMLMGSVAEKVVRISTVPVLTVKPRGIRDGLLKAEDIERELHLG
jgi:universal stress protein A